MQQKQSRSSEIRPLFREKDVGSMSMACDLASYNDVRQRRPEDQERTVRIMSAAEQFHVSEVSPSCWRVTFDNGSVNLLDPDTIDQLGALIGRNENDPDLTMPQPAVPRHGARHGYLRQK